MKNFYFFTTFLILCYNIAEAQTYYDIPGPENVLVVYNLNSGISDSVQTYYVNARNIPEENVLGLDSLINLDIYDPETQTEHYIELQQQGEIIVDVTNEFNCLATPHAWIYFNDRIAKPIANYLKTTIVNGDTLKNTIRFIVLCKGIPHRIQARWKDWSKWGMRQNVPVDGLLCLLGETMENENALLEYLNWNPDSCYTKGGFVYSIANPYYNADPNFSMEHFFLPNKYKGTAQVFGQTRNISLSYLITHLTAPRYSDVTAMIDRSIDAINAVNYDWFIDAYYPVGGYLTNIANATEYIFNHLDIENYYFEKTNDRITEHEKPIMTYSSLGVHSGFDPDYIQSQLNFTYAPGAFFNTVESFNGKTLGTYPVERSSGQGQVADFTLMGGTVGVGHAYEPTTSNIVLNSIMFPSYALGYTFIEAAYLGMPNLTGENVVVGDPLTRITYPCEPLVLTGNTTISSGDYDCDIVVPEGITLTIAASSTVNFTRNADLQVYGTLNIENSAQLNFNGYSQLTIESTGSIIQGTGTQFTFNDLTKFIMDSYFEINSVNNIAFNNESEFQVGGVLDMGLNSNLTFNNITKLIVDNEINLNPGTIMYFNNNSQMRIYGKLNSLGEPSNKVTFNFSNSNYPQFYIMDGTGLNIDNTIINNSDILFSLSSDQTAVDYLSITNTVFNNIDNGRVALSLRLIGVNIEPTPTVSNCTFNNCEKGAIDLIQVQAINIENNTFSVGPDARGIHLSNTGATYISGCTFTNGPITNGSIGIGTDAHFPEDLEIISNLFTDLNVNQCVFETEKGIELDGIGSKNPFNSVIIDSSYFYDCVYGIRMNNTNDFNPIISNNIISGNVDGSSSYGLFLINGNEMSILNNKITNFITGIHLGMVSNPSIVSNFISAIDMTVDPGPGIFAESCNGKIRKNTIEYHSNGIELGGSSPDIAENIITNNDFYGIYVSAGSNPDLGKTFVNEEEYPLTGYNEIRENGVCNWPLGYSEIYIKRSSIKLSKGCNTIADDRINIPMNCDYTLLLDGKADGTIYADSNYWGDHPVYGNDPSQRFGADITVDYIPYLSSPCTYNPGSQFLLMTDANGNLIDTVYSSGSAPGNLSGIESSYATANGYYYNKMYSEAKQAYQQIVQDFGNDLRSTQAYNKLFSIEKMTSNTTEAFNQLKDFYQAKLTTIQDSVLIGSLTHLSNLCLVAAAEYQNATINFDEIVQANQNTDVALYREIDALTTALLIPQDSSLGKGIMGKYAVKDISDYTDKVSRLLKQRNNNRNYNEKPIPKEYSLLQNYPNPFNPSTIIKYSIVKKGEVKLTIYDILGREVSVLVDEIKDPGYYEVNFNASNLASGVYFYRLVAGSYVSTRKMLLLK